MVAWRRPSAIVAVAALGMSLSACSSSSTSIGVVIDDHDHQDRAEERSGNVPNQDSVRKDVQLLNCGSTKGGWSAGGTVRNTLGHDTTFDITVFFTSTEAMDLASAATSVPLNAHQSKLWSVKGTFAAPAQVLCVLRGVATH